MPDLVELLELWDYESDETEEIPTMSWDEVMVSL